MRRLIFAVLICLMLLSGVFAQADPLQVYLNQYIAPDEPGMALLVQTDSSTWLGAAGLADLKTGTPIQTDDRFRIGSITKTFVAVLMLQLQETGLLSLDDSMSEWLEDDVIGEIPYSDQITLRQLLNMTSGIFNYTDSDFYSDALDADPSYTWVPEELVAYAFGEQPYFPPGEGYYYSNTNYILLELVIQRASGNTLADELHARIFEPLGMTSTYMENGFQPATDIVRGYDYWDDDDILDDVTWINDSLGRGDGGIISTIEDMARFANALLRDQSLLTAGSWAEMIDAVDDGEGGHYGLGLGIEAGDTGLILGHDGATAGFQSTMWYDQEYDILVVALTNNFSSDVLGYEFVNELMELAAD